MSGERVDVLAVMDAAIESDKRVFSVARIAMHDARAAVAELIEADKRIDFTPLDHLPDDYPCVITVPAGDLRRRNAALSRIQPDGQG